MNLAQTIRHQFEQADDPVALAEELRAVIAEASPFRSQPVDHVRWVPVAKVRANDYNPNSVARTEMSLLYTSIERDGYCVEASTPILMTDLTWRPAGTLKAGDKVIAFDEFATDSGNGRKQRRYRTGEVTSNCVEASPVVEVVTNRGTVQVTPDHPFLARRCYGKGHYGQEWIEARDLKPNDLVIYLMEPWKVERSWEAGWLAGFLDGEGTIACNQVKARDVQTMRLSGYQRPGPTAERMVREMSARAHTNVFVVDRTGHDRWNNMVMARIDRMTEIMRLLGTVRPERLIDVAGAFWDGAALSSKLRGVSKAVVQSVTDAGVGRIARLATSTRTYIGNGFAMHNTQPVVTIYDKDTDAYVIVDGFHRYYTMLVHSDIAERTGGRLPVVVIDKGMNERMAATVRHNRARGKHSVAGMSSMIFEMLENGWSDAEICNELGMEAEELLRLKHITGFSKLFEDVEYRRAWQTKNQIRAKCKWDAEAGAILEG